MASSRKKSPSLLARICLWALPCLFVLLVAGYLGLRAWLNAYLESAAFRDMIAGITARQLKARNGEYMPFRFSGAAIYSEGFKAEGTAQAGFSDLGADQIRADVNLSGLWNHVWEIDQIGVQRVQVSLGHTGGPAPAAQEEPAVAPAQPAKPSTGGFDWLPKKVDLRKIVIQETDLKWGENTAQYGSVKGATVTIAPDGEAWNIYCEGGSVFEKGGPALTIDQARLRYQRPSLFITDGQLRNADGGTVAISGEVNFDKELSVQARLGGIPVTPFLREDWRAKLKGNLFGDLNVQSPLPVQGTPQVSGSLSLAQGELEALPILDQIATFTQTQRFRRVTLTKASANFTYNAGKTTVTNFVADSEGLIRVEGGFIVANNYIDGTFQVGVTPSSLQWLPGSQEKVFTVSHDGYLWTTMRLSGPVDNPKEDLSPRLIAAAAGSVIDTVQGAIQKVPKSDELQNVPKKLLDDFVTPLLKQ